MKELVRFFVRQRDNLLFLALMMLSISMLIDGNMHQRAQAISSSRTVVGNVYAWRSQVSEFANLRAVNQELAEALAHERERNQRFVAALEHDTTRTLDTTRAVDHLFLQAKVINSSAHKERNFLTLDRGSAEGIVADRGVIGAKGIVGRVREVSPRFAVVLSILNHDFSTSVKLKGTGHYGLFKWDTHDPYTAHMADVAKHVPVSVGDTVVTRGGDVFPPDIPVGYVTEVTNDASSNFHTITFRLAEDMVRVGYVHVVNDLRRAERDSLEAKVVLP